MNIGQSKGILLLGATGVGKSPLGDYLEECGWAGCRCWHFDFGNNLRKAASGAFDADLLTDEDVSFVQDVLQSGALLENETFYIAENILKSFVREKGVGEGDYVVLNGLPRHEGQAQAVASIVEVKLVIYLRCLPEVVVSRIENNSGGDRGTRTDDTMPEVRNKIDIFNKRTIPLLDHYRQKNVRIEVVEIGEGTSPADIVGEIVVDCA
jgi:adenylate kinase